MVQNFKNEVTREVIKDPQTARLLQEAVLNASPGKMRNVARFLWQKSKQAARYLVGPIGETTARGAMAGAAEIARNEQAPAQ